MKSRLHKEKRIDIKREISLKDLGYSYKRYREMAVKGKNVITSATAAEAIMAVWRERPHQAKFLRTEIFGKLYQDVFNDTLNGAQLIIAILIFRFAEKMRKQPIVNIDPDFIPLASHVISM